MGRACLQLLKHVIPNFNDFIDIIKIFNSFPWYVMYITDKQVFVKVLTRSVRNSLMSI